MSSNKNSKKIKRKQSAKPLTRFEKIELWMEKNKRVLFPVTGAICILFSLLLFNSRISEGNDDSLYIEGAYNYSKDFFNYYFTANAPLYPMLLSIPIKLWGINLVLLKSFSLLCHFFSLLFFYKAFKNRVPHLVLYVSLLFFGTNSYMLYFSSQTYTESFYLFLQSVFLFFSFKLIDATDSSDSTTRDLLKKWALFGCIIFILSISKNIITAAFPAIILFFAIKKQWKNIGFFILSFAIFRIPYEIIRTVIWGSVIQFNSQASILMLKDPYNPAKGNEEMAGFITRFFDNCNIYISKRFFQILGFRSSNNTEVYGLLSFIVFIFIIIALVYIIKNKNPHLLFSLLFSGSIACITFIVLQVRWDQPRMIMIHMPVLILVLFYGFYHLLKKSSFSNLFYFIIAGITVLSMLISTSKKIKENLPALKHNLAGDEFYGYTPDWVNFLKMSRWCSANLPKDSYVASRKAPMSFVYGNGMKFYPVYKVLAWDPKTSRSNPDSLLVLLKKEKVTHIILASLRMNPDRKTEQVINTIHNMIGPIQQKYPQKLKLVHQEGAENDEPSYLFELKY